MDDVAVEAIRERMATSGASYAEAQEWWMNREEHYHAMSEDTVGDVSQDNPKYIRALKDGKPRMEYLVGSVLRGDAAVHAHGADKYGERNWRIDPIKASTYEAAILRHFMAYFYDGEDVDPDSGLNHLYHIRACCAVMLDSIIHECLTSLETSHPGSLSVSPVC